MLASSRATATLRMVGEQGKRLKIHLSSTTPSTSTSTSTCTTTRNASTKAKVPKRKPISKEERTALRAARKAQALQESTSSSSSTGKTGAKKPVDPRIAFGLGVGVPTVLLAWGIYDEHSPPAKFSRWIGLTDQIESFADEYARPSRAKLLPDWSQIPNVPQNMAPPHTLVLDLENTLVNSSWDRKHGWRHAKRPGVDKFLSEMAQYYEIVLYTPSHEGVAEPVIANLDKNGAIMHRLYRDACYYKNGTYVKDLKSLNRNTNKIVLLDDDAAAAQMDPANLIRVKPYDNPRDRDDKTLQRITPFLIEIAIQGYDDVPQLLRQFQGMDADEIADELERRVQTIKDTRQKMAQRGLGAFSNMNKANLPQPEMTPVSTDAPFSPPSQLTAKDLVGAAPPSANSDAAAGLSGWLQRRQKEQEEQQMRKMEKWNEVMMKKSEEKRLKEQEAAAKAAI